MKKRVKQFIPAILLILCISILMCSLTITDASAELTNEQILDDNENGFGNYYVETIPDGHTIKKKRFVYLFFDCFSSYLLL